MVGKAIAPYAETRESAIAFSTLKNLRAGASEISHLQENHLIRMIEFLGNYADLPMDMADASLVILVEHLGHGRILSSDRRDSNVYRWRNKNSLENLLNLYFADLFILEKV